MAGAAGRCRRRSDGPGQALGQDRAGAPGGADAGTLAALAPACPVPSAPAGALVAAVTIDMHALSGLRSMVAPGGINLLPGCVGGTPGGGSINTTRAAFAPGARTRGANLAHALSLAAILLFVRDAIAAIPLAVMARTVIASGE